MDALWELLERGVEREAHGERPSGGEAHRCRPFTIGVSP
jgi:hypothetical protein